MTSQPVKGYLSVAAAAAMWASSGVAGKALFQGGIPPVELVQVRVTLSALILALIFGLRFRRFLRIRPRDLAYFLVLGGVAMALVQFTYFKAISKIHVAAAIFLQYQAPVLVTFYSICFWRERLTGEKLLSLLLAMAGCYLVVGGYNFRMLEMNLEGTAWGLSSALCFAVYILLGERGMHRYPPWTVLFYAFLFATLSLHLFYSPLRFLRAAYTFQEWGWMIYVSVVGTLIPFGLFFLGVNQIRATRAAITATLEPIFAGMIAYLALGEALEGLQLLGGGLVVTAVVLLQAREERDDLTPAAIRSRREPGGSF